MKKFLMMACAGVLVLGLSVQDAEAKRLGGGASKGMQRESVTQKQATPPTQAAPHTPAAPPAAPVAQPKRSWMGPLAGLAAGLGIAALMSHFGMGEAMGNMVMIMLLVVAAMVVFKLVFRKRQPEAGNPLQYAAAGPHGMTPPVTNFEPLAAGGAAVDTSAAPVSRSIPADFDQAGFLRVAKVNFIRLQAANDAGNLDDIREFTTPEMFAEIKMDIDERKGAAQETDVQSVEAVLLDVITEPNRHIASVRFHGMISEDKGVPAASFDEVWHLVKPLDNSRGWAIAGIQQLN